jgi:hypothetical protein
MRLSVCVACSYGGGASVAVMVRQAHHERILRLARLTTNREGEEVESGEDFGVRSLTIIFCEGADVFFGCLVFMAVALLLPLWFDRLTTNGCWDSTGLSRTGYKARWAYGERDIGIRALTTNMQYTRPLLKRVAPKHFRAVRK